MLVRWLLQVTRPVLSPLLGSTLCRITDMLCGVALFSLGAYAVARAGLAMATDAPVPAIWPVLAVMAGLSLLKAALRYAEQFLGHLVAFKALELLRGQIFRSLIPRSPRVSATSRSGDLLSRATKDVDRIEVFFAHTFAPAVCAVVVPITVLTLIGLKVSWLVALAALPFVVLQLLIVPRLGFAASVDASRSVSAARAELTQHVTDTVQGMSEVVGYGRSQERLDEMARIDAEITGDSRPTGQWAAVRRGVNQLASLIAPIVVVMIGSMLPATGSGAGGPLPAAAPPRGWTGAVSASSPAPCARSAPRWLRSASSWTSTCPRTRWCARCWSSYHRTSGRKGSADGGIGRAGRGRGLDQRALLHHGRHQGVLPGAGAGAPQGVGGPGEAGRRH